MLVFAKFSHQNSFNLCLFRVKNLLLHLGDMFLYWIPVIDDIIYQFMTASIVSSRPRFIAAGIWYQRDQMCLALFAAKISFIGSKQVVACASRYLAPVSDGQLVVPEPRLAAFVPHISHSRFAQTSLPGIFRSPRLSLS